MFSTLMTIFPIFSLIILGKILKDYFYSSEEFWQVAEKISYYILFPALLINALVKAEFDASLSNAVFALMIATLLLSGLLIVAQYFLKVPARTFTSLFQGAVRYNSYIFIGIGAALYGTEGVAIVAIFISYMIILTNTLSVLVLDTYLNGNKMNLFSLLKNLLKNPLILSSIIGMLLNQVNGSVPIIFITFLDYLGKAALPLSLMCVGAGLNLQYLYHQAGAILSATLAKLIILPIFVIVMLSFFNVTGLPKLIAILYAAVPCAGNSYILAKQMGGDAETMAAIISVSTLVSIITIPIVLAFFP